MRIQSAVLACVLCALPGAIANGQSEESAVETSTAVAKEVPDGLGAEDWTSIRAAYEAGRHRVFAVDGGHLARNPGQQWTACFDGRGFTTTPDAGGWSWGLDLVRYGWGADQREVAQPRSVSAEGGRVAYAWDERLGEWFVNGARGLEHGYTVSERPEDAAGPLVLELSIRGELLPEISTNGSDVRFVGPEGGAVLTYAGLAVFDADGRTVAAGWKSLAGGLQLRVHDQDARYPLTIDPIAQQAYLKASNTESADQFGGSVAVSGDTVVVGAHGESSNATGVNGHQGNNDAYFSGAAYVFVRSDTSWSQQAYLKASNTGSGDYFGYSVAVSGDTVVVGALRESSNATGVNGHQGNNNAPSSGAAYVFVRNGTTWSQQAYLKASNTEPVDAFGWSVAVSGDTVVMAALEEDSNATGVNGNQGNNDAPNSGAAYVFVRNGTSWSQQAYLKASNPETFDYFGWSLAVSGDTVAVGAFYESSDATGVNGNQGNNNAYGAGAAYVFVRSDTSWSQQAYLKASNTESDDQFGTSVAVSGNRLVVGAPRENSNATGVNGNQSNSLANNSGAAYVFVRNGTTWSQQAYLKASNTGKADRFGTSVAVSGGTVVVGATGEASNATGVNGNQGNNLANDSGAAYVFVRNDTTWSQQAYLKASNTDPFDYFGWSVAVSGDTMVVGTSRESSNATGVNGNQANNDLVYAGAAYVFLNTPAFTDLGGGLAGVAGIPLLEATGTLETNSPITLTVTGAAPSARAILFVSLANNATPFRGGTLGTMPIESSRVIFTNEVGEWTLPVQSWVEGVPPGTEIYFQVAVQDPAAVERVSISNLLAGTQP